MKNLLDNRGFSIIQVMVAIGLMGGLSLALMRMMENQNKQSKTAKLQMAENNLKNKLSLIANKKEFCNVNFKGRRKGTDITELLNRDVDLENPEASVYLAVGEEWEHSGLVVVSMRILSTEEEEKAGYKVIEPTNDGSGEIRVRIKVRRKGNENAGKKTYFGGEERNIDINISARLGYYHKYTLNTTVTSFEEGEKNQLLNACTVEGVGACQSAGCQDPDRITGTVISKRIMPCKSSCAPNAPEIERLNLTVVGTVVHNHYSLECLIIDDDPNQYIDECITND